MESIAVLLVIILLCLFAFFSLVHSSKVLIKIIKTSTSKLSCANSGLVELKGNLLAIPNHSVTSYGSTTPCLWWSYKKEQQYRGSKGRKHWKIIDTQISNAPLKFNDGTDICYIFPDAADIKCKRRARWKHYEKSGTGFFSPTTTYRITEEYLVEDDFLYVLGNLKTINLLESQKTTNSTSTIIALDIYEKLMKIKEPQQTTIHYIAKDTDFFVLSARKEIWLIVREIGKILLSTLATIVCAWFIYMQLTK